MTTPEQPQLQDILAQLPPEAGERVECAFQFARQRHDGVFRSSGTPFLSHVLATANDIAGWTGDTVLTISALLHDVLDQNNTIQPADLAGIRAAAGDEIAQIVGIVHELGNIQERNLFWGMELGRTAQPSVRMQALLVKLASGLELARNLKFIQNDTAKSQQRGRELLAHYAPLAVQFGMWEYKRQLEDLCLAMIAPAEYQLIGEWQRQMMEKFQERMEQVTGQIRLGFQRQGLRGEVELHPRHIYSVYQLLSPKWTASFQEIIKSSLNIDQLVRLNLLTGTSNECYLALGVVHRVGSPAHDLLRDFVAIPKANGYAALHTAIQLDPRQPGIRLRVNIRTRAMNEIGRQGILYRPENKLWLLGDAANLDEQDGSQACAVALLNTLKQPGEPTQNGNIFALTPQGKRISLPCGATPLDFAYAVFSGLGDKFSYASVNHQIVAMNYALNDGDLVEIHTNPNATPQAEWLEYALTPRARQKIRRWLENAPREIGKSRLQKALTRQGIEPVSPETQSSMDEFIRRRMVSLDNQNEMVLGGM